jgi:hypothetical protein
MQRRLASTRTYVRSELEVLHGVLVAAPDLPVATQVRVGFAAAPDLPKAAHTVGQAGRPRACQAGYLIAGYMIAGYMMDHSATGEHSDAGTHSAEQQTHTRPASEGYAQHRQVGASIG